VTLQGNNLAPDERRLLPTDARFTVRALLLLMSLLAVGATIFGFILRQFSELEQFRAVVILLVVAAILVACVAFVVRKRRRLERDAGVPRFVLVPHSYLFPRAPRLVTRIAGTSALVLGAFGLVMIGAVAWIGPTRNVSPSLAWNGLMALSACSFGISALWWNRGTRLCDGGLLVHDKFLPWDKFQRCYWDACYRDVLVLETWIAVRVPAEIREQVEAFVRERIAAARPVAVRSGHSETAAS
jgi:hypothetical protein